MVEDDVRIKVSRKLAEAADMVKDQTALHFDSRNEVFRHALRAHLLDLTRVGVLPPQILGWKK